MILLLDTKGPGNPLCHMTSLQQFGCGLAGPALVVPWGCFLCIYACTEWREVSTVISKPLSLLCLVLGCSWEALWVSCWLMCATSHLCQEPWPEMWLLLMFWTGCTCITWWQWEHSRLDCLQHRPPSAFCEKDKWEVKQGKKRINEENSHPKTHAVWWARLAYVKGLTKVLKAGAKQDVFQCHTKPH